MILRVINCDASEKHLAALAQAAEVKVRGETCNGASSLARTSRPDTLPLGATEKDYSRSLGTMAPVVLAYSAYSAPKVAAMVCSSILLLILKPAYNSTTAMSPRT